VSSRETLEFIVSYLVDYPDDIQVTESDSGRTVVYELAVHPDDVGKVIGRNGRIAKALRTIVRAAAARDDQNAVVEILG
jgi:predicted RNA-binding protein YlqC (UPF0109 family)